MNYIYKIFKGREWHEKIYLFFYYLAWIMYIFSIIGISSFGLNFFQEVQHYLRIYISLFLIIKFNPWGIVSKYGKISNFDRIIAFQAGIFILTTTLLNNIINNYISNNNQVSNFLNSV